MHDRHRINRVITRSGDDGSTGLADGSRVPKDAPVVEALGAVDELGAALGVLAAEALPADVRTLVITLQHMLFELGGELAVPGAVRIDDGAVAWLEAEATARNATLPPLREFVLAGGSRAGAWCHYCRTLARRAERRLVALARATAEPAPGAVNPAALAWLNRLSDLLFILARHLNRDAGVAEQCWQPRTGAAAGSE